MSKERIQKLLRKTGVLLQDDDLSALEKDLAKKYLIEIYDLIDNGGKVEGEQKAKHKSQPKEPIVKIVAPSSSQTFSKSKVAETPDHRDDLHADVKKSDPTPVKALETPFVGAGENAEKKVPEVEMIMPAKPTMVDQFSGDKPPSIVPPDFRHEISEVVTRAHVIADKYKVLFKRDSQNELSDKLSLSPIADLRRAHGINDKLLVVNELFSGQQESYLETVDVLNAKYSFADAQSYLVRYIIDKFGWLDEEKIEPARDFIKLVERRFLET